MPDNPELTTAAAKDIHPSTDLVKEQTLAERHPDWPPVKLTIFFGAHLFTRDMAGFEKHIQDADIFMPEAAYGDANKGVYQAISNKQIDGNIDQLVNASSQGETPIAGTDKEVLMRSLYGRNIIIGHMDLLPGDEVTSNDIENVTYTGYQVPDFEETLHNYAEKYKQYTSLQGKRDEIIVKRFEEEMSNLLAEHPELKEKTELKVVASMGAHHVPLTQKFREAGIHTERAFPQSPYNFDYSDQVIREIQYGKEPSKELLAKAYLNEIFVQGLFASVSGPNMSSDQMTAYGRELATHFAYDDIRDIHARIVQENGLTIDTINDTLHDKGLDPLPTTYEQVETHFKEKHDAQQAKIAAVKAQDQQGRNLQK